MSRLIDADDLLQKVREDMRTTAMYLPVDFLDLICEVPAVDAIPVDFVRTMMRHGAPDESKSAWRVLKAWEEAQKDG